MIPFIIIMIIIMIIVKIITMITILPLVSEECIPASGEEVDLFCSQRSPHPLVYTTLSFINWYIRQFIFDQKPKI